MLLELRRFEVPPGQRMVIRDVSWAEFERILEELGDSRASRLAYDNGLLEIAMPLPEHEDAKEIIGDLLKALMEELDIEFRSLGSTIFKQAGYRGIEPDQCFYIQNELAIRGKKRIDLAVDPPPDLALEIDLTSRSYPDLYAALGVPELWQFERGEMTINALQDGQYVAVAESPNFPGLPLRVVLLEPLKLSETVGRNKALRAFRQWVRSRPS
ncbi:MAG: Uma2 family endonuclease [Synechococcales cyanobacterium RM1_1_8]|nr:Uma2 family endonuclease [Synechococcales cyanobacterium RM1_1_8]